MTIYVGSTKVGVGAVKPTVGIPREIDVDGIYQMPTTSFTFSLPPEALDIGNWALAQAFNSCRYLSYVELPNLIGISGYYAMYYAFSECPSLASVDLSKVSYISGIRVMDSAFVACESLISVDLSSLTTINHGSYEMNFAFSGCIRLTSVDLSSLTTVSGNYAMYSTFYDCTGLTSVDLSSLVTINGSYALTNIFYGCERLTSVDLSSLSIINSAHVMEDAFTNTRLTELSFPALNSNSFGSYTNQFSYMLSEVTGCTVHFPSNLQSVIGSWTDVTEGFGGTNTTVLFDLPATT